MPLSQKSYRKKAVQMPMTALIDIVFLLLIYFLLTTNYLTSDVLSVELPQAVNAVTAQTDSITITIDAQGTAHLAGEPNSDEELRTRLVAKMAVESGVPVVVRASRSVSLERVVTVMDIASGCGVRKLSLATKRHEKRSGE